MVCFLHQGLPALRALGLNRRQPSVAATSCHAEYDFARAKAGNIVPPSADDVEDMKKGRGQGEETLAENPYAPPRASDVWVTSHEAGPDGVRTFGILLIVRNCWLVINLIAQSFWDFRPTWMKAAEITLVTALGIGLIRVGRKLVVPTLALLVIGALERLIRVSPNVEQLVLVALVGPLFAVALEFLPALLLLDGAPSRARFRAALVLFTVAQLLLPVAWIMRVVYSG